MMKKYLLLSLLFISSFYTSAQEVLSYNNHALLPDETSLIKEIQYVGPGNSGPNQIWDFSKITRTGIENVCQTHTSPSSNLDGVSEFTVLLTESGHEYYFNITPAGFEEQGYTTKDLAVVYSDPVLKMKYPFTYGESFTDKWVGHAIYQGVTNIDLSGDYSVTADAFGTLILPDRTLNNTLRLKTEKNGVEMNPCSSTVAHILRYLWYAPGYRYPVLVITVNEYQSMGQEAVITKSAAVNLQQTLHADFATGSNDLQISGDSEVPVNIYPNPFSEKISYHYFLRKQIPVTLDLYNMTGKYSRAIISKEVQTEGVHSGEINAADLNLTPGVYYLRFTFENKVFVKKIVKV